MANNPYPKRYISNVLDKSIVLYLRKRSMLSIICCLVLILSSSIAACPIKRSSEKDEVNGFQKAFFRNLD